MIITLKVDSCGTPCFGKIVEIILTASDEIIFAVSLVQTLCYYYHFHAYEILDMSGETHLYQYKNLHT